MSLTLHVVGANATAPSPHGGSSAYLVESATGLILIDAGPGSLLSFSQQGYRLEDLHAIVLTHLHADHSLDMMAWAYRWTFPFVRDSIPVYIPAGEEGKLEAFDDLFGIPTLPTMVRPITGNFTVKQLPMDDGETVFTIDGVELRSYAARHAVPSAALRFSDIDGTSITFSSDTGDCAGLNAAAKGTDIFVCEATYLDPDERAMAEHGHLTPVFAGKIAEENNVGHLVLTHFANPEDGAESARRAATTYQSGAISIAKPGLTITA